MAPHANHDARKQPFGGSSSSGVANSAARSGSSGSSGSVGSVSMSTGTGTGTNPEVGIPMPAAPLSVSPSSKSTSSKETSSKETLPPTVECSPFRKPTKTSTLPAGFTSSLNAHKYSSFGSTADNDDHDSHHHHPHHHIGQQKPPFVRSTSRLVPHNNSSPEPVSVSQRVPYYLPCSSWLPSYSLEYFFHDLVAGLSLASYQIPLSMSFASAVAHVPPICGLLGLSFAPMVYAVLGSSPQMIVGPEAAISMIVGQKIEKVVKHTDGVDPVDILTVLTCCSGAILFAFGLLRFGFIDNVLCGSLLKGFITAIGLTIILNSIIAILGLDTILSTLPRDEHVHSAYEKLLMVAKKLKKMFVKHKFKKASFFPEIMVVVLVSTFLSAHFRFDKLGIQVLGKINVDGFKISSPIRKELQPWYSELFGVSFMCAILGFFESSTASKSLGTSMDFPISSNRELVALGAVGVGVSFFGSLPSFGGYARSKLNAINGAKTPLAGFFMGLTALIVTFNLLDYVYYLPLCVLNAVMATVGLSLVQETPKELRFHLRTKGYNELITFVVTLTTSLFFSVELGVALGCFYSVLRVIKHSTKSRIQILSRVAGTDTFINSDYDETSDTMSTSSEFVINGYAEFKRANNNADGSLPVMSTSMAPSNSTSLATRLAPVVDLQDKEGCLIVKIPEPLTFTNTNDLKSRLKRIEMHGSAKVHPATRKKDIPAIKHIVFDLNGMTSLDSSAAQILYEIIIGYQRRGINVFFCRVFKSAKLYQRLQSAGITDLLVESEGSDFGIKQTVIPYYDEILDALKAIDSIESSCDMFETQSYFSDFVYEGN